MIEQTKPNPFHVLRAAIKTAPGEIVELGRERSDTAETDEERLLVRWAVEQIITRPDVRIAWEILEPPGTAYADAKWESFVSAYRRPPKLGAPDATACATALFDWPSVVNLAMDGLLEVTPPDLEKVEPRGPLSPQSLPPALEVADVLFG